MVNLPLLLFPKWVQKVIAQSNEVTLVLKSPQDLHPVLEILKNHSATQFKMLIDITAVDYPSREARFEVVYHLLSVQRNTRLRLKVQCSEHAIVESVTSLYPAANWFERETWDMFGICFTNHPDLRRILTDYGFEGHPLRKDFPLTGYVEFKYDDTKKRVVAEPVELAQQFRQFEFRSPWEVIPQQY
ncbi:nad9 (mitochondrion) [Ostreococcus tauri]|uniref:Mitochondrion, complete genome n=1 Tax=Ostreococcus tauri TaxID=70448 RepID=Q0P3H3_OSTTA|nr:nad9 [Ostreococcus tauri]AGR42697.1 NADH dehydrogenase subunit 9 [Ostreococcus tauri]AGR42740.1 NADH dehydrogenase subunit 9 [Ostreococcus tauri]AGR42783.1 NADH dehydrogenase subunit 9 [Ostreococcus tauri]AGR42826.1 NADH dehydrogenase subunit 9 [Ostreococcus tauri]AGR42869.1 NADH dehydrogenase subunit 9 [Ostreococcus tauri]|eukprot:YP_717282.1 nad9 (mitochondrion) [Ostreococcus tauri]